MALTNKTLDSKNLLINKAVKLVIDYYESENLHVDSSSIVRQVLSWYNSTDIAEPILLATAAINYGDYQPILYTQLVSLAEIYFPEEYYAAIGIGMPADEIDIEDIEIAQQCLGWM